MKTFDTALIKQSCSAFTLVTQGVPVPHGKTGAALPLMLTSFLPELGIWTIDWPDLTAVQCKQWNSATRNGGLANLARARHSCLGYPVPRTTAIISRTEFCEVPIPNGFYVDAHLR
jgi:hypothetical protein